MQTNENSDANDGKKKIALALGALAITSAAAIGIVLKVKKGKPVSPPDIRFNNGGIAAKGCFCGDEIVHITSDVNASTVNITEKIAGVKAGVAEKEAECIKEEARRRTLAQAEAEKFAEKSQEKFNAQFNSKLSNKSAEESAEIIETEAILEEIAAERNAQAFYNKPFEEALSNKSAFESAKVLSTTQKNCKNTIVTETIDKCGNKIIISESKPNKNKFHKFHMEEYFDETGLPVSRTTTDPDKLFFRNPTTTTRYENDKKITNTSWQVFDDGYGTHAVNKIYKKNAKGKYEPVSRETDDSFFTCFQHKSVEHLSNGTSETVIENDALNEREIIRRDKKGNIISHTIEELYDDLEPDPFDKLWGMLISGKYTIDDILRYFDKNNSTEGILIKQMLKQLKAGKISYKDIISIMFGHATGELPNEKIGNMVGIKIQETKSKNIINSIEDFVEDFVDDFDEDDVEELVHA